MLRLPKGLQWFLTWLTGKPLIAQQPMFGSTPYRDLWISLILGLTSIALSFRIAHSAAWTWLGLPITLLLTVSSMRRFQGIMHQCVHGAFDPHHRQRMWILAETISIVLIIEPYSIYKRDHISIHHTSRLASDCDPDMQFLTKLGFCPGTPKRELWLLLRRAIVSLRFHAMMFESRISSNCRIVSQKRRLIFVFIHLAILIAAVLEGRAIEYSVAWLLPLTALYQVSSLLQLVCEHRWQRVKNIRETQRLHFAKMTVGRFLGTRIPEPGMPLWTTMLHWIKWGMAMAYHLGCRLFVLVGDLPAHDWHHRHPGSPDWPNAIYARQRELEAVPQGRVDPYEEVWGLHNAIDAFFDFYSHLPRQRGTS